MAVFKHHPRDPGSDERKNLPVADEGELAEKLTQSGLLSAEQAARAVSEASNRGVALQRYLVGSGILAKDKVYQTLAEICGVPYVDISMFRISPEALKLIPGELAHRYRVIPLFKLGEALNIAMQNPKDVGAVDRLTQKCQCSIEVCLASGDDIDEALKIHYGSGNAINQLLTSLKSERTRHRTPGGQAGSPKPVPAPAKNQALQSFEGKPVIQLVDLIIKQGYEEGASDIHIEPEEKILRVRYRVDGVLHEAASPPKELESEIISRIKVLAEMDIAETRIPQDSRIKMKIEGKDIDMRVSSMPTVYGENVVIRILKDENNLLDLSSLGFSPAMQGIFEEFIRRPYGMILETGPTGSGKTTTLYAALKVINNVERNIVTIEDPVEYKLPMIRQIPVNNKAGLTFANALRSILRQDPDVIMVGEIRDEETAQIAIQSALTGHLVLSTLHANSAAGVVSRLVDMKIEPFLVASSVIGVISQRLIRRLCDKCKIPYDPDEVEIKALQWNGPDKLTAFRGKGCRHCRDTGYKGRIGIFEMLRMNDAIQKKIMDRASTAEIEKTARQTGNTGLRDDALFKIREGLTSVEEVIKTVGLV